MQSKLPSSSSEIAEAAIKGAVSAIPVVGGLIAELGGRLVSPLDRRKHAWAEEVERALQELAAQHQRLPEALADDPAFVTALLKATSAALATHQKKKINVLRAFVVAVGSKAIPDEELQHALLRLLEDLSVGHIEVLCFLEADYSVVATKDKLEAIFSRYREKHKGELDRMAFRWILSDLASRMVIHLGDVEDMNEFASQQESIVTEKSKVRPLQITQLGRQLLELLRKNDA
jgi:hypothetical protein